MLEPFHFAFVQRGLVEILLLSVAAGLLGTWIVLRGLTFYSHAVATAAFPGLVVADGLALSAPLCAFVAAIAFAFGVERLARNHDSGHDSLTALVLVGALALGVILASDVFHSGASVETLLFGSLLLIGPTDIVLAGVAAVAVVAMSFVLGRRWLAAGFDPRTARALGVRSALPDAALLGLIALTVIAALSAVGALLATALVVVPAGDGPAVDEEPPPLAARIDRPGGGGRMYRPLALGGGERPARRGDRAGRRRGVRAGRAGRRSRLRAGEPGAFAGVAAAGAALLVLAGCGSTGSTSGIEVVATTTQIGDWVRQIGGPDVSVHQILQPNTDPHEYEPRPKDVERTAGARIVFESGDGLDRWMGKVVDEAGGRPAVVVLGDVVPVKLKGETSGPRGLALRSALVARSAQRGGRGDRDPQRARGGRIRRTGPAYDRRAAAYTAQLRALDARIGRCFAAVPAAERRLVTDHDAFNYFAARYRIQVVGAVIPSQTTQAQPSAGEIARLIAVIRREHVHAVFPESSLNSRLAQTIADETGARSNFTLYGDTLGPGGSTGSTYVSMEGRTPTRWCAASPAARQAAILGRDERGRGAAAHRGRRTRRRLRRSAGARGRARSVCCRASGSASSARTGAARRRSSASCSGSSRRSAARSTPTRASGTSRRPSARGSTIP